MTDSTERRPRGKRAAPRTDRIEHGSPEHAVLLGLKKASNEDIPEFEGFALADVTMYGPAARPEFLEQVLRQKVRELRTPPAVPQSDDPNKPDYAPPMILPPEGAATGLV